MVVVLIVLVVVLIVLVVIVLTKPLSIILAGGASQQARNGLHSISVLVVDTSHLVLYWQVGPVLISFFYRGFTQLNQDASGQNVRSSR